MTKSNYEQLAEIQKEMDPQLKVILVPCNQYAAEEPDDEETVVKFASMFEYKGAMLAKTKVKGAGKHELYKWLAAQKEHPGQEPSWNFAKFLLASNQPHSYHTPETEPKDMVETIKMILDS